MLGLTETSARSRPSTLLAVGAPKLRSEREGLGMEGGVGLLWNATLRALHVVSLGAGRSALEGRERSSRLAAREHQQHAHIMG